MNVRTWQKSFRVGTTSYIVEDDLVANAAYLAQFVEDMQLVLFDIPGGPSNLPGRDTVDALASIGSRHAFGYTVHLLDDLLDGNPTAEAGGGLPHPSVDAALKLIDRTRPLDPWAWVGHLDGRSISERGFDGGALPAWQAQAVRALQQVCDRLSAPELLAIENLEGYPADFVTPVVERTQAARCVDVGHLWVDGCDPRPHLRTAWPRLRVVHLHGVVDLPGEAHRDHRSLAVTPPDRLDSVVHFLLRSQYTGLLTLEIFGEEDFHSSLDALDASIRRFER